MHQQHDCSFIHFAIYPRLDALNFDGQDHATCNTQCAAFRNFMRITSRSVTSRDSAELMRFNVHQMWIISKNCNHICVAKRICRSTSFFFLLRRQLHFSFSHVSACVCVCICCLFGQIKHVPETLRNLIIRPEFAYTKFDHKYIRA